MLTTKPSQLVDGWYYGECKSSFKVAAHKKTENNKRHKK